MHIQIPAYCHQLARAHFSTLPEHRYKYIQIHPCILKDAHKNLQGRNKDSIQETNSAKFWAFLAKENLERFVKLNVTDSDLIWKACTMKRTSVRSPKVLCVRTQGCVASVPYVHKCRYTGPDWRTFFWCVCRRRPGSEGISIMEAFPFLGLWMAQTHLRLLLRLLLANLWAWSDSSQARLICFCGPPVGAALSASSWADEGCPRITNRKAASSKNFATKAENVSLSMSVDAFETDPPTNSKYLSLQSLAPSIGMLMGCGLDTIHAVFNGCVFNSTFHVVFIGFMTSCRLHVCVFDNFLSAFCF